MLATPTTTATTTTTAAAATAANKQTEFVLCQQQRGVCAMFAEIYTSFHREGACDALHFKHLFMYIQVTVKKKERAENTETEREGRGRGIERDREGVAGHRFVSAVFVQLCYILHKPGQFSCGLHFICTT